MTLSFLSTTSLLNAGPKGINPDKYLNDIFIDENTIRTLRSKREDSLREMNAVDQNRDPVIYEFHSLKADTLSKTVAALEINEFGKESNKRREFASAANKAFKEFKDLKTLRKAAKNAYPDNDTLFAGQPINNNGLSQSNISYMGEDASSDAVKEQLGESTLNALEAALDDSSTEFTASGPLPQFPDSSNTNEEDGEKEQNLTMLDSTELDQIHAAERAKRAAERAKRDAEDQKSDEKLQKEIYLLDEKAEQSEKKIYGLWDDLSALKRKDEPEAEAEAKLKALEEAMQLASTNFAEELKAEAEAEAEAKRVEEVRQAEIKAKAEAEAKRAKEIKQAKKEAEARRLEEEKAQDQAKKQKEAASKTSKTPQPNTTSTTTTTTTTTTTASTPEPQVRQNPSKIWHHYEHLANGKNPNMTVNSNFFEEDELISNEAGNVATGQKIEIKILTPDEQMAMIPEEFAAVPAVNLGRAGRLETIDGKTYISMSKEEAEKADIILAGSREARAIEERAIKWKAAREKEAPKPAPAPTPPQPKPAPVAVKPAPRAGKINLKGLGSSVTTPTTTSSTPARNSAATQPVLSDREVALAVAAEESKKSKKQASTQTDQVQKDDAFARAVWHQDLVEEAEAARKASEKEESKKAPKKRRLIGDEEDGEKEKETDASTSNHEDGSDLKSEDSEGEIAFLTQALYEAYLTGDLSELDDQKLVQNLQDEEFARQLQEEEETRQLQDEELAWALQEGENATRPTPAPVAVKPAPVAVKPAPVAVKPAPVAVKPAPVAVKPAPVKPGPRVQHTYKKGSSSQNK